MSVTRERFDKLRAAYLQAHAAQDTYEAALAAKYGRWQRPWLTAVERKRVDAVRAKTSTAEDRIFGFVKALSPRDWSRGVPCAWVACELTFEDAARPLGEPLAVVPPLAFGYVLPMR